MNSKINKTTARRSLFGGVALAGVLAAPLLATAPAEAAEEASMAEAGILSCQTVDGTRLNLLVHSNVDVRCSFKGTNGGTEYYTGTTGIGVGIDLTWEEKEAVDYTVLSAGEGIAVGTHSLAGKYGGAKASVAAGKGIGATALVGGSNDHIALQPIGIEHSEGIGVAAGLSWLSLEPAGEPASN